MSHLHFFFHAFVTVSLAFYLNTNLAAQNYESHQFYGFKIYPDSLHVTNEMPVSDFLQGRVSGLDIIAASGDPGRNDEMVLRGLNPSGINSPLVVIDGIPWWPPEGLNNNNDPVGKKEQRLIPVALKDVASIEILKDGSSTALYGAEGANGVILIETKKGVPQKMQLSFEFNLSLVKEPSFMPMLSGDEYIMYQLEAWHNAGSIDGIPSEIALDSYFADFYNYSANTDWMKAVTQKGNASSHFLTISGGNNKSHYYSSIGYLNQKGTIINTGYKRLIVRNNYERYLTDKLTLSMQLSNAYNHHDVNLSLYGRNILEMAFIKAPNMSIMKFDPYGYLAGGYFAPPEDYQGKGRDSYYNPVAVSELGRSDDTQNDLTTTARLQYNLTEWLRFAEIFTYLRSSSDYESSLSVRAVDNELYASDGPIMHSVFNQRFNQFRNEIRGMFKLPFKNENLSALDGSLSWIWHKMRNKISYYPPAYDHFNEKNSIASSINYRLVNRYMLNINTRIESVLGDREIWDKYLGFSAGWRFSDEPLLKSLNLPECMIYSGLSSVSYHQFRFYKAVFPLSEPEIRALTYNMGIQLGSYANRVRFAADYYSKKYNIVPSGTSTPPQLKSKSNGWEVIVDYKIIKTSNVNWHVNFNWAHNNTRFTNLPGTSLSGLLVNGMYMGSNDNATMGSIYGLIYEGLYANDEEVIARDREGNIIYNNPDEPGIIRYDYKGTNQNFQPGDVKYKDLNYDGIINENDVVCLGNSYPKFTGGFGSTFNYKNLSLTCNFNYRSGYKVMNLAALQSEGMDSYQNQSKEVLRRWKVLGQGRDLNHRAYRNHPANNLGSDRYVANGGFLRLNYISLGYDLSPRVCQYLSLSEISLSLSAQRLLTFSEYEGIDPEIDMESNGWHNDVVRAYPPKIYTFSIQVGL